MRDIVERLRRVAEFGGTHLDGLWTEAADEIVRLRTDLDEMTALAGRMIASHQAAIKEWSAERDVLKVDPVVLREIDDARKVALQILSRQAQPAEAAA